MSSVTLGEWLKYYDIDWRAGLCVNIATDGLKPESSHLLAVGMQFPGEDPSYTYVRGGFPDNSEYHGITFDKYRSCWLGPKRAQEILRDTVAKAQFLVVNNHEFFSQWMLQNEPPLSAFGDYPVVSVSDYAKFLDGEDKLVLTSGESLDEITALIRYNIRDKRYHGGYSLRSLCSRITGVPSSTEGILFEQQTLELTRLFCALLWA